MRHIGVPLVVLALALPASAQDEAGWSFNARFQGSSSGSGLILKADPSIGYKFNRYIETYAGLPIYFVNDSSTTSTTNGFMNGIGNGYLGARLRLQNDVLSYSSNLVVTAPTGDKDRGFSTGRVTVDWTNTFSRTFSAITPFASAGVGNTVSDTAFFVRPFSSHGLVSHFEGGAMLDLSRLVYAGASAYAVRGSGEQRIVSRVVERQSGSNRGRGSSRRVFETQTETVGSDIADDHGFSTWMGITPRPELDLQIGYSRSAPYALDSLFFGIGLRVGK
ncbi:MAG: hypothetical protein HY646_04645 [Acidobacteria bacterium]|nr:hypothetical protein [Acidobacteriota bacterium]